MTERLDKWLSSRSAHSRRDVHEWIKNSKVRVNGVIQKDAAAHVCETDEITVNGEHFSGEKHVYIMMHKPKGVVSVSDAPGDTTVIDLLPDSLKRNGLFPAGRLDRDTTGFVLITDDGEFAHRILSPRHHVTKTYSVTLRDPAQESYAETFRNGIQLADGTQCLSAEIEFTSDPYCVIVHLHEGRYHQVKRMFASLGNTVVELHRDSIGGLSLDPALSAGESRLMTAEEVLTVDKSLNK